MKKSIISLLLIQMFVLSFTLAIVVYVDEMFAKLLFVILNVVVYVVTIFFIISIVIKDAKRSSSDKQREMFDKISATLAHELRTSLTIILGNTQVLENLINSTNEEVKKRWGTIYNALTEMNEKIDEIVEGLQSEKPDGLKKDA